MSPPHTAPETGNLGDIVSGLAEAAKTAIIEVCPRTGAERRISYAELRAAVDGASGALAALGLPIGARIALLGENSIDYIVCYLAAMRAGFVAVPMNVKSPTSQLSALYERTQIALSLFDSAYSGIAPTGAAMAMDDLLRQPGAPVRRQPDDDTAEILFTSGSTGLPKGVLLSHRGQRWVLSELVRQTAHDSVFLVAAPLFHMNGQILSALCLAAGGSLVLMRRFDSGAYLACVDRYRCTNLTGVPTMFALMAREKEALMQLEGSSVRQVFMGSAPLTATLFDTVQTMFPTALVQNGYGATEIGAAVFGPHPAGLPRPKLALGHPYERAQVRLGQGDDEGELFVKTPALMSGYDQAPSETAARYVDGWYKTGDIMRRDENNFYYFIGRADDMFVCGGENIYPTEIERLLEKHPGVRQAAVVPADDAVKGALPVAFVVQAEGAALTAEMLRQFALQNAPAYLHPRAVVFVSALPLSGVNKIDRKALKSAAAEALAQQRPA